MATELDAARLLIYRAAANTVDSSPSRLETSMAKVKANEVGQQKDVRNTALGCYNTGSN